MGSSQANVFTSVASGMSALSGPLHGGANQEVVEMLQRIHADGGQLRQVHRQGQGSRRPLPALRASAIASTRTTTRGHACSRTIAHEVIARLGADDPLLDIALTLEEAALADDYFIERKLYPNVDFYSGLMFRALGFPMRMFTVLFALGRLPGWIAQWKEMTEDPDTKIGRPRQVYVGHAKRDMP